MKVYGNTTKEDLLRELNSKLMRAQKSHVEELSKNE